MELLNELINSIKQVAAQSIILSGGIMLFSGYFLGKLSQKMKLPAITGYILAGLVLGHSVAGIVAAKMEHTFSGMTEIALGLIALTIGGEFNLAKIKRTGSSILIVTFFQAMLPFLLVTFCLNLAGMDLRYSLLLGAISIATAPAATVVIIRELRARGEFIDYVYGIVAFDDALCMIIFGIVFAVIGPSLSGIAAAGGALGGFLHAFKEIVFSALLGVAGGTGLHFLTFKKYKKNEIQIISLAVILLVTGITVVLHLSPLIANMLFGVVLVNFATKNKRIFAILEPLTPPVFAFFFILAGTEFSLHIFSKGTVVLMGGIYVFTRFAGRLAGVYLGAVSTKLSDTIKKYLGLCFTPQAGVAIGLALFMQSSPIMFNAPADVKQALVMIVNIILFSVFINELVGPPISKYAIIKGANL